MQNTSHAVMSQRHELPSSLDDFPTPPWVTRALLEHVLADHHDLAHMTALEPACGRGHMASVLHEYFGTVIARDVHFYGYGAVQDFLDVGAIDTKPDWVVTNPPFELTEQFVRQALAIANRGVAILLRTSFLECQEHYERLFNSPSLSIVAPFAELVPMLEGRLDPNSSTSSYFAWFVWLQGQSACPRISWILPCRDELEQPEDYAPRVFPLVSDADVIGDPYRKT